MSSKLASHDRGREAGCRTPHQMQKAFRRRSTARLLNMLGVAVGTECHCDGYVNFVCGKHDRIEAIESVLDERGANPLTKAKRAQVCAICDGTRRVQVEGSDNQYPCPDCDPPRVSLNEVLSRPFDLSKGIVR